MCSVVSLRLYVFIYPSHFNCMGVVSVVSSLDYEPRSTGLGFTKFTQLHVVNFIECNVRIARAKRCRTGTRHAALLQIASLYLRSIDRDSKRWRSIRTSVHYPFYVWYCIRSIPYSILPLFHVFQYPVDKTSGSLYCVQRGCAN